MSLFRIVILVSTSVFALALGVLFVFPVSKKDFSKVEFGGVTVLAEIVSDPQSRSAGLSGRERLPELGGMLFLFDSPGAYSIWMKEMKFPLDIIWLKDSMVVDIEENVSFPESGVADTSLPIFTPDVAASAVLEVASGFSKKYGIRIGDRVNVSYGAKRNASLSFVGVSAGDVSGSAVVGEEYFVETLRKKLPWGKNFRIEKMLAKNETYRKFQISYKLGDLTISGVMNIPAGKTPRGGFPVLILNHGLIDPSVYFSGRGSRREQDFFARNGYATIHPDYRGHAESSSNPYKHHDFYVGYTEDVVALVDALKILKSPLFDASRIGMWGHSMGGGIAARVMVLRPEVRAFVLFAPISADAQDNFYELSKSEIDWLAKTYGVGDAASKIYQKISPLTFFKDVSSPVQLHHGTGDTDVPIWFSEKIYKVLTFYGKKAEFFKYPDEGHEFGEAWQLAAERSLQFFDRYVKSAK